MPLEIRRIEFSEIELRDALAFYQAKTEGGLESQVGVSAVKVMGGNEFNIVAKVSSAKNDRVSKKVYDHATAIAMLVLFSKKVKIPLPRNAPKVLSPTQYGGVSMTVRYEHSLCAAAPVSSTASVQSAMASAQSA